MKRYVYIDVSNTKQTTREVFDFAIDWEKLIKFLRNNKWECDKIFYYEGGGDAKKFENKVKRLKALGYEVRTKPIFFQTNRQRNTHFICGKCKEINTVENYEFNCRKCSEKITIPLNDNGRHPKANFDVEITADALEYAGVEVQILLFTGDGDFRYLAEKLIDKGAAVIFVSTYQAAGNQRKRFSTRLKELIAHEESQAAALKRKPRVRFLEISNFKHLIAREDGGED
jgi:uncharacterized LabA/DUF88 family protein